MGDFIDKSHDIGGGVDQVGFETVERFDRELEAARTREAGDAAEIFAKRLKRISKAIQAKAR